jgi:putative transcription antitermination factor YqgF
MANILSLDVGSKRIGVAGADSSLPIAVPLATLEVNGQEVDAIAKLIAERSVDTVVVGYPRNNQAMPPIKRVWPKHSRTVSAHLRRLSFRMNR